jgi:hypothetical protein
MTQAVLVHELRYHNYEMIKSRSLCLLKHSSDEIRFVVDGVTSGQECSRA